MHPSESECTTVRNAHLLFVFIDRLPCAAGGENLGAEVVFSDNLFFTVADLQAACCHQAALRIKGDDLKRGDDICLLHKDDFVLESNILEFFYLMYTLRPDLVTKMPCCG